MTISIIRDSISDCCKYGVSSFAVLDILNPNPQVKQVCNKCKQECTWKTFEQIDRELKLKNQAIAADIREDRRKRRERFEMIKAVASGWLSGGSAGDSPESTASCIIRYADAILKEMNKQ